MKITKEQLKQIIKEEMQAVMDEAYASAEPQIAYDFTDEQKEAMRKVIEKLNNRKTQKYATMVSALRFLKYRHPAFKGFKGEPLDIQNGLKSLGYKGYTVSTTAIPEAIMSEAEGETPQQAAERLKSMPPHRLSSVIMDFEDMADGDTSLQQYYPHVKDLAAFAREVLSLMGNK